jgi:protocatechuate 3,4-dioxygenase beta subunit
LSSSTTAASATTANSGSTTTSAASVRTAEQEHGPYYAEAADVRADIVDGKQGVPMGLRVAVVDATSWARIPNAAVDVWMADALGEYSDAASGLFLRGIQLSGDNGVASFASIYSGWYPGRTNHVHIEVHIGGITTSDTYTGGARLPHRQPVLP